MEDQSSDYTTTQEDENTANGSKLLAIIDKLKTTQDDVEKEEDVEEIKGDDEQTEKVHQATVVNGNDVILIDDEDEEEEEVKEKESCEVEEEKAAVIVDDDKQNDKASEKESGELLLLLENKEDDGTDPVICNGPDTESTDFKVIDISLVDDEMSNNAEVIDGKEDDKEQTGVADSTAEITETLSEEVESVPVVILPDNQDLSQLMDDTAEEKEEIVAEVTDIKTEDDDGQFALEELLPELVVCTACGKRINPLKKGVCQHPELGVLVCKSCLRFYNSSPFNRDSNGMEEHCKWCAEGGTLVMCDFCEKVYCEQCIKRNLGKDFYTMLLNADDSLKWQCFACDKTQLEQLHMQCNLILKTLDQLKLKGVLNNSKKPASNTTVDAAERKARLTSLSESLGSPLLKSKAFRLDSPDHQEDALRGQKSVTEKVRKKKIRIVESDDESAESNVENASPESTDNDSSDENRKQSKGKWKGPTQNNDNKSGMKRKRQTSKKKDNQVMEEEKSSRKPKGNMTVKLGFGKSRMKTRRKGKLLLDITDPGLGTSKSYANEECFSSEHSDSPLDAEANRTVTVSDLSGVALKDFVIRLNEPDPRMVEEAYHYDELKERDEDDSMSTMGGSSDEESGIAPSDSKKPAAKNKEGDQDKGERKVKPMGKRTKKFREVRKVSDSENSNERGRNNLKRNKKSADKATEFKTKQTGKRTTKFKEKRQVSGSEAENESVEDMESEASVGIVKEERDDSDEEANVKSKGKDKKVSNNTDVVEILSSDEDDETEKVNSKSGNESSAESSEDSDNSAKAKKKSRGRKVLSSSHSSSSSDSEVEQEPAARRLRSRKRLASSDSSSSEGPRQRVTRATKGRSRVRNTRKRRRQRKDTSDEEDEEDGGNESDDDGPKKKRKRDKDSKKGKKGKKKKKKKSSGSDSEKESPSKRGRKNIRRILKDEELTEQTKHARQLEEERRKRLLARTETKTDEVIKDVVEEDSGGLALERNKDGIVVVSVAKQVSSYLKPHQREGVKFLYDCVVESVEKWKEQDYEGGCLLAHCMGLGKTLQVVALVHTLMNSKNIGLGRVMVVAPLNTVLNWQVEFEKWLNVDDRLEVYVLNEAGRSRWHRTNMLSDWNTYGGVLILGYEMYRNLSQCLRIRSKKQREIITKSLVDPGPELVVCDEGHILRNDQSAISKALNNIKTKRRVVLTGTPLQNNLIEYHCMVNFVKPSLLGTRKEFTNRFVNPIVNGQLSNSTTADVRIMKQRCHILHELLSGCVLRRDYSVLTPFLSPKHEYTIFVRLSEKQRTMYQFFLDTFVCKDLAEVKMRGISLFSDYQCLMRIWTHPWAVKLEALRRMEREKYQDDMEDFLNDESEGSDEETQKNNYKQGSDSSDFESRCTLKKKKKNKVESDDSEEEEEEEEDDDSSEEEEEEEEEESIINTRPSGRRTRASAAAATLAAKKKGKSDKSDGVLPSFINPGRKKASANIIASDEEAEEESILVVEPSVEPSHKTTRSGSSFKITDDKIEEEPEWYDQFLTQEDEHEIAISGKLVILMDVLADAEVIGDKVLVFSQSLVSLDLIEKCLGNGKIGGDSMNWCRGVDYFRMDGSTNAQTRQRYAEIFNDSESTCRLFLISTRAGSLGINLVAANRVVIFDCSWNPSHDMQSIFRVYRFGQTKPVFVYRLVAQGTMEEKIYNRQITKMAIAGRVVDEQQIERHFTDEEIRELYVFQPDIFKEGDNKETPQLPKDPLLAEVLQRQHPKWIVRYHEHDLLLENLEDEKLSEEERKQAWAQYEEEKNTNVQLLARLQMEQERMKELMRSQENRNSSPPLLRVPPPPSRQSSNLIDGARITQAQAEAIFRQLQFSGLPGQTFDRSQIFRQYTDASGRTVTKMQIPSGATIRMLQPPQDQNLFPRGTQPYRIDGLASHRGRYQIPPHYNARPQYAPRTTGAGVMYRSRNPGLNVRSLLGFDPYQSGSFNFRGPGSTFRLPNRQGR